MKSTVHRVSFIFIKFKNKLIFQLRDNKSGISSPGMIAAFGGSLEDDETPTEGAIRELHEETSLRIEPEDLKFLGTIDLKHPSLRYAFLIEVHSEDFLVFEGQGKLSFSYSELRNSDLDNFTPCTKKALLDYLL